MVERPPPGAVATALPVARDALRGYLDSLLREATAPTPAAEAGQPGLPPSTEAPAAAGQPPAWAGEGFEALLFDVGGLRLAVPLVRLHAVLPWSDRVTGVPGQPAWSMGLTRHRGRSIRVLDTAVLVASGRAAPAAPRPSHLLVVGDGGWGLACDGIGDVVRLRPEEVRWRGLQGRRPWLAGTLMHRLCALLDTDAFADMLEGMGGDRISNHHRPAVAGRRAEGGL